MDLPPEFSGQENQKPADDKTQNQPKKIDWKKVRITAALIALIEAFSLFLWQEAEDFNGMSAALIHWVSKCGVLAGGAFVAHKISKSPKTVWFSYAFLCLVVLIIPFTQKHAEPNPVSVTPLPPQVVLIVSQPPIAVEPLEFRRKHEGIFILLGGCTICLPPVPAGKEARKDIGRAFLLAGTHEHPSQIQLIANENQVVLNIKFAPIFGMPPLELTNNELSGLPSNWDCNHSAKAVEVVNENLIPIFHIYYKDDTHLVINGAITYINNGNNGFVLASETNGMTMGGANLSADEFFSKIKALNIKPLFKYPAWQHPGEYADK
jgi:hypothetical protein